jgi:hypothetical protein
LDITAFPPKFSYGQSYHHLKAKKKGRFWRPFYGAITPSNPCYRIN